MLVSAALRFAVARAFDVPWISPDEMIYGLVGQSLWETGLLSVRGISVPYYSLLTPLLVGLPLTLDDLRAGIAVAQALQAVAMSLVAVPVYLWGRRLAGDRWAIAAAALAVLPPALWYGGLLMTEALFYTLVTAALVALARMLEEPTLMRQGTFLLLLSLAAAVRLQALVLLPALILAVGLEAWFGRSSATLRRLGPMLGLVGLSVVVTIAAYGADRNDLLGAYGTLAEMAPSSISGDHAQQTGTSETRTIEYLGKKYTVPQKVEKIVITGAMEAMEDAVVLDVHPIGAISVGGQFPEIFASVTGKSEAIGEKQQPNFEKILQLKPDVILGSTKFQKKVVDNLQKIAPIILVSHISTDWESNLKLMGELSGKQAEAEKVLTEYETNTQAVKASLKEKLQGKKVAAVRIRGTQAYVYPKDVYFNPVLYDELGLEVPEQISKAKTQEAISVEQLAEMNPDYLFVQFSTRENQDAKNAFDELKKNPIIQSTNAFKQDHVYVNVVDPLLEGGPAYSRIKFLESVQKHLDK